MNLFKILNANNYFTVNREIAREIGLNAAILLSEVIDKYTFFEANQMLDEGWFYLTIEEVERRTTLAKDAQKGAIDILKKLGFLETKQRGMPAKRFFKVFKDKIIEWGNSSNKKEETRKQDVDNSSNKKEEKPPTAPIYKSPSEEPNIKPPTPLKKGKYFVSHGSFVKLKPEEYEILCKDNSKDLVDLLIEEINDYIASSGRKQYVDYAATIRSWVRRRSSASSKFSQQSQGNVVMAQKFAEKVKSMFPLNQDIRVEKNGLEFILGASGSKMISYTENGFEDQVRNQLRKWNLPIGDL